jgi:hypothetical protein
MNLKLATILTSLVISMPALAQDTGDVRTGPLALQEAYLKAPVVDPFDYFGHSVATDGTTMVVGAIYESSSSSGVNGDPYDNSRTYSGAAYVFRRNNGAWEYEAYLKEANPKTGVQFGFSVAVWGDTIAVGAPGSGSGKVTTFRRVGGNWTLEETLQAFRGEAGDQFGWSVSLSKNQLLVGAPGEDGGSTGIGGDQNDNSVSKSGAAYAFSRNSSGWRQKAYFKSLSPVANESFGYSTSLNGDTAVIGVPYEGSDATGVNGSPYNNRSPQSGAAYVFVRGGGNGQWSLEAYLKAFNTGIWDLFGYSVSVAANTIVIGAPSEDSSGRGTTGTDDDQTLESGAAYVFTRKAGVWSQHKFLKPMNTAQEMYFGKAVSIYGNTVAIGSPGDRSRSNGIDGRMDEEIGSRESSGSVQLFYRVNGIWVPFMYVKALVPDRNDLFGSSVAFREGILASGSYGESSSSTGVNGDAENDDKHSSGAAYAIHVNPKWGLARYGTYYGANYPDLYSDDHPIAGQDFTLRLDHFSQDGSARLVFSRRPDWIPHLGGVLHVDRSPNMLLIRPGKFTYIPITSSPTKDFTGKGEITLPLPAAAAGFTFYAQAAMHDPTQSTRWALTNGLKVVVGS